MGRVSRQNRFRKKTKEGVYQPHRNTVYCAISYLPKPQGRRGDGAAERAGLENRRWGNSSASSNLAPSAIFQQVVNFHPNYLSARLSQVSMCRLSHFAALRSSSSRVRLYRSKSSRVLRTKNLHARLPETTPPSLSVIAQTKEKVVNHILEGLNQNGMDSKQSVELLEHIGRIIEMGMKMTRGTTY